MGDGSDDDFTFCQVRPPVNESKVDTQNVVPGISNMTINDEVSNGNVSKEERRVGSLSFTVTSATPPTAQSIKTSPASAKSPAVTTGQKPMAMKKPTVRAKVPFEKGYSQMDWFKLTRTQPDLAGIKGQSNRRLITMSEVKQHQTEGSMWTVFKGHVYNIYPYMKFHPGGVDMLMKAVGKDCTSLFNKYHAWVNAEFMLEKCLVGILDVENSEKK